MKRYICAALAAALLMPGMWAVSARAQDDDAPPPPEQSEHHEGGKPDGAKMAEHMKKALGLTDEQAAKFKDAMKAHGEAMKPLFEKAKDVMKKLGEQLKAKAPDAEIQKSLDGLKAAHKAIGAEEEQFRDGLASFLTPTQRGKMAVGMAMHMRREHEGRGRMGKHGPKGGDKDDDEKGGDHDDGDHDGGDHDGGGQ